ncbi:MAG TPA: hypothetical protein VFS16_12735 [Acidimicrobiia bacterium]|nr:hypothetical protein [Acidimicrobiia bacterium]
MESKRTKLGHQLGVLFCLAGFVLVWVGWNGAASYDNAIRQFPYLISGGIAGLGLIHVGVGMWIVQTQRAERGRLEDNLAGLNRVLETLVAVTGYTNGAGHAGGPGNGLVLAGKTAYHRPACRLVQDHPQLTTTTAEMASESGLIPCRTCEPQAPAVHVPG